MKKIRTISILFWDILSFCYRDLFPFFKDFFQLTKILIFDIICGRKYCVRVNKVWSVCRGRIKKESTLLKIKYGKDRHKWILSDEDWYSIDEFYDTKEEIENKIIALNIRDLLYKKCH